MILKKAGFPIILLTILFSACYKKSDELSKMNDKIIDVDYTGGKWFDFYFVKVVDPPGELSADYLLFEWRVKESLYDNYDCQVRLYTPDDDSLTFDFKRYIYYRTYDFTTDVPRAFKIGIKNKHGAEVFNVFSDTAVFTG